MSLKKHAPIQADMRTWYIEDAAGAVYFFLLSHWVFGITSVIQMTLILQEDNPYCFR
jgi:hypothetical protein